MEETKYEDQQFKPSARHQNWPNQHLQARLLEDNTHLMCLTSWCMHIPLCSVAGHRCYAKQVHHCYTQHMWTTYLQLELFI
jgi:hypothetical protein